MTGTGDSPQQVKEFIAKQRQKRAAEQKRE
jgi:hypothetical protein